MTFVTRLILLDLEHLFCYLKSIIPHPSYAVLEMPIRIACSVVFDDKCLHNRYLTDGAPGGGFRNYPAELFAFSARLGESVDESGLRLALTERSYMLQSQAERQRLGLPDTEVGDGPSALQTLASLTEELQGCGCDDVARPNDNH